MTLHTRFHETYWFGTIIKNILKDINKKNKTR
jgi:hypothetical protein